MQNNNEIRFDWPAFLNREITTAQFAAGMTFVALAAYGFRIFNFVLNIDEEVHARNVQALVEWISQARWGMYVLNYVVFPFSVVPVLPPLVAIVAYSIGIAILIRRLEPRVNLAWLLGGVVALTFPTFTYILAFNTISYGVGLATVVIALGFTALDGRSVRSYALACLYFAFALGVYQSFVCLIVSIFLFSEISGALTDEAPAGSFHRAWRFGLALVASVVSYFVIHKIAQAFAHTQTQYVDGFVDLPYLRANWGLVSDRVLTSVRRIYFTGDDALFIGAVRVFPALMIVSTLVVVGKIWRAPRSIGQRVLLCVYLLGALLSPFALHVLNKGEMPFRTMVSLPLVVGGLVALGFKFAPFAGRVAIATLGAVSVFTFCLIANRYQGASYLSYQTDRLVAWQMIERLEQVLPHDQSEVPFEVVGYLDRPRTNLYVRGETLGGSFFTWDEGHPKRVAFFLETLGYLRLRAAEMPQRLAIIEEAKKMPTWPLPGSVQVIKGVAVIKMGEYSSTQKDILSRALGRDGKDWF